MPSAVEAYQNALSAKGRHDNNLRDMFKPIHELVKALRINSWGKIIVDGIQMPIIPEPTPHFDPKRWPDGQSIANTLLKWHELDLQVRNAWLQIPETRRIGLTPPP